MKALYCRCSTPASRTNIRPSCEPPLRLKNPTVGDPGVDMGYMHEGAWHVGDAGRRESRFVRTPAKFRDWIGVRGLYEPEPNRYHLYVSKACPWASRTVIVRKLKKLESVVPMTTLHSDVDKRWLQRSTVSMRASIKA